MLVIAIQVADTGPGTKTFTLTVADTSDNAASIVHHVRRDFDDPEISLDVEDQRVTGGGGAVITGRVRDGFSGPGWVEYRTCNQSSAPTTRLDVAADGSFRLPVAVEVRTSVCLDLVPYDKAGRVGTKISAGIMDSTPIQIPPPPAPRTGIVLPPPPAGPAGPPLAPVGPPPVSSVPGLPGPAPVAGAVFTVPGVVVARGGAWRMPVRVTRAGRLTITAGRWRTTLRVTPRTRLLTLRPPARVLGTTKTLRITGAGKPRVVRTR